MKPGREITLEFQKIVGEGKALGRHEGKVVFAFGILPGETARVRSTFEKKNFIEAELLEIITPAPDRVAPKEDHYLSCSPWQVMAYESQARHKKNLIEDLLYQTTKETIRLDKFYEAAEKYGYRTKIEYSFTGTPGNLQFAFHKRGTFGQKHALPEGCALMGAEANKYALEALKAINAAKLKPEDLKTFIIRESKRKNERIGALYVKREDIPLPEGLPEGFKGFLVAFSNPLSPVSQADKILSSVGHDFITEVVAGSELAYGFDCFFQNNIDLFDLAMAEIREYTFPCDKLVDLYSGVGAIGLNLRDKAKKVIAVEAWPSSVQYARLNAMKNRAENFEITCSLTEKSDDKLFEGTDILVLDPPRAGVHGKVIKRIMEILPKRIIYLSCNPITQGRDTAFFLEKYKLVRAAGFDFYPNTPHVETLLVFDLK